MLPPNYALSGMKQIKNDYHTNVMYDIAKVAGKLQIFVAHTPIDLSTVLIPNDGSFEQSLAGVISEETKIKLEESLKYLHQMQKRKNKKFDYYGLWGELGIIRQETQNDYTFDQLVEWAEQEHFEYEETKVSCPKIDLSSMLIHNNRPKEESFEALDEEAILDEQNVSLEAFALLIAIQYEQLLQQQQAESSRTRNPIFRERDIAEARLMADYFSDNPKYSEYYFKRRLYKIIAKILANRLVSVLGDLVNEVQTAFVADRQILDGPFILDEVLQWCRRKKKHALIFKVDFEKAFDSVRWDFVDDVLNKFGFGERWRTWIQSCLRSSRGSILVNGSPTEEFQFFRGLKQGDPLSPFLFILIMESLHISFQRVVDAGLFTGIKINSMVNLSHLFYADDAIFLGQWSELNIDSLVRVLDCFFRASGLRINMCKSKIMGVNVEDGMVKNAASKLGCLVLKTPFTYLGTKVGGNMSRKQAWKEVVDKVLSRLSRWKMKLLSIGGRLTLLKSVLGSMPIFHMSIFKVPSSILKSLESIRSRFFNGQDPKSNKASWVKWNKVLTPKDKGGLGVSSLFALNRGLMLKWVWRFYSQKCSLWTKVIKAIYGEDGNLNKDVSGGVRTCWTSIVHEVRVLQGRGINVADYIRLKLGNGENTRFWVDNWYEGGVIKELFPRMFALELNKNATVSSKLNASSLDNSFRRKARSGIEEMQLNSLAEISRMTTLVPCEDRYVWTLESDGVFSVASIRKEIDGNRFQDVSLPTRWVKSVPIKVNIIAWKVKSNALPTRFNISRRGMDIDSIVCPICNAGVESTNHIFFQCVVVRQIMRKISSWWNIDYSDVNSYEEWQVWLVSIRIQSKLKGVLEGVYYGLWWYMWNFRNKLLFDKKIPEKALIFDNLVSSSFYWCKFRCKASFKWDDWLKNLYIVLV
ncbi:RNA-directed DNA polymerase, eukaryota, reverse transcriptase zinc-binding domain protein [Tanacetum coccineum]